MGEPARASRQARTPGRDRKPSIPAEKVVAIVHATLHEKPVGETHWSCRSMAKAQGVSSATVQRIWSARNIKPHRVKMFKLSNDKRFEEKLVDVVGLYLNPPEKAIVLSMDEKSQIQALDRTQPSLPMKKGRAGTMTLRAKGGEALGSLRGRGGAGRALDHDGANRNDHKLLKGTLDSIPIERPQPTVEHPQGICLDKA
jgi:hypothetical protein